MNYVYYGYLAVALFIAYLVVKGKGNSTFSIAYMASITVFVIDGLIYWRYCSLDVNDPTPVYHALSAVTIFFLLHWAKRSYKIKLFDRRFR